jgi:hypothetical protein
MLSESCVSRHEYDLTAPPPLHIRFSAEAKGQPVRGGKIICLPSLPLILCPYEVVGYPPEVAGQ